jgi:hypothetical protein
MERHRHENKIAVSPGRSVWGEVYEEKGEVEVAE